MITPFDAATEPEVDPRCPDNCEACAKLPERKSVRAEQRIMLAASMKAQTVFSRTVTETVKLEKGSPEAELMNMSLGAMLYGSALASVIGLLLKEAPELAHKAVAIHQDMYSDGDLWFTEDLYAEIEAENAAVEPGSVAPEVEPVDSLGTLPLPIEEVK